MKRFEVNDTVEITLRGTVTFVNNTHPNLIDLAFGDDETPINLDADYVVGIEHAAFQPGDFVKSEDYVGVFAIGRGGYLYGGKWYDSTLEFTSDRFEKVNL